MLFARMIGPILLAVAATAVIPFQPPASADPPDLGSVTVTVEGMACPFCAYGLEKSLERLPGVEGVDIDIGKSRAILRLGHDGLPGDEDIRRAVREAGLTPGDIERENR